MNYHGVAWIVGWIGREQNLLIEYNETNFNYQKGNFYAYEAAGIKIHQAKDCIIRRNHSHGNNAFGIWTDYQCERNRVTQNILTDNMDAGFFFEVSAGPILGQITTLSLALMIQWAVSGVRGFIPMTEIMPYI